MWKRGLRHVAGIDEVGRGCFAGPVVAGCVVFSPQLLQGEPLKNSVKIDDSKKLTERQRERAGEWIKSNALSWGVGEVSAASINRLGLAKATNKAFRAAVIDANKMLKERIEYLLIDAFYIPYTRELPMRRKAARKNNSLRDGKARQRAIVNGDEKAISIAAASIIAKVYRDSLMRKLGNRAGYAKYDWENNKGYASIKHQEAILKFGVTRHHRKQFIDTFLKNRSSH